MKLKLLAILLIGSFSACYKPEPTIPYWGNSSVYLNGKIKEFYPSAEINEGDKNFSLSFRTYADEWLVDEHFYIDNIPLREGTFHFHPSLNGGRYNLIYPMFLRLQKNSDTAYDTYELPDLNPTGFVTISKIKDDKIWGTFETKLYKSSLGDTLTPEIYHFTTGEFKTKIL